MEKRYELLSLPQRLKDEDWDSLLNYWAEMISEYTQEEPGEDLDIPFWYGERSITGLLAAAAWKLHGGWSLEEFIGLRLSGLKRKPGKGDLWLGTGKGKYTIEAKIVWSESTWRYAEQHTRDQLKKASDQLKKLDQEFRYGTCIALCYVVPEPLKNFLFASPENINEIFDELPSKFVGKRRIVAKYRLDPPPEHQNRLYPGIIIVGTVIKCS